MSARIQHLFFDMNSYFASVAQAEEPWLMGRPLGILTTAEPGAACIAASIEAKRAGVRMGTRQQEARQLCPDIIFRAAKHDVCVRYHHAIKAAVDTVLPIHRTLSIDEFSCLLIGRQQELENAKALGRALQKAISQRVHPALRCSVGLANSRLLAKVASDLEKPNGLNWILSEDMPDKLAHLKLSDIPGISFGIHARLERAGITDIKKLYALDPKAARALWGSVVGERFLRELRGETVTWPETKRGMIGHGQILNGPNKTQEGARLVARRLLVKAASRLRREGYFASRFSVGVKCAILGRQQQSGRIKPTQDTFLLLSVFERYWAQFRLKNPMGVEVNLGGLVSTLHYEPDLFDRPEAGQANRRAELCARVDVINLRFGQDTVRFGNLPLHRVPYTGAKIAFGRIPDWQDFLE